MNSWIYNLLSEAAKPVKPSKLSVKEKPVNAVNFLSFADPEKFVNEILEKASALIISEVSTPFNLNLAYLLSFSSQAWDKFLQTKDEKIKQHGEQIGTVVSNSMKHHLRLELQSLAVSYSFLYV